MVAKEPEPERVEHEDTTQPIKVRQCPECGSPKLMRDYEVAEIVCMDCGFVVESKIADRGPEWRAFDHEQRAKRTRVGAPLTYTVHDKGLSTMIDTRDKDIYGKRLPPAQKAQIYRLRKWQRRIRVADATERNLAFALAEISKIGNNLALPKNILETASVIYRKAVKEHIVRGRSIQGVTAGAIYVACRQCKLPRTLEEIAKASGVDKKQVGRNYRSLVKELDYFIPPPESNPYITKLCDQLDTHGEVEATAYKIVKAARETKPNLISGRGPMGVAAASCYIASVLTGGKKTQRELAEAAQVTEVTIRNRYKDLLRYLMFTISL